MYKIDVTQVIEVEEKFTQIKLVVETYAFVVSIDIAYILNERYRLLHESRNGVRCACDRACVCARASEQSRGAKQKKKRVYAQRGILNFSFEETSRLSVDARRLDRCEYRCSARPKVQTPVRKRRRSRTIFIRPRCARATVHKTDEGGC